MTDMAEVLDLLGVEQPVRWPGHIPCIAHEEDTASLWIKDEGFYAFCCGVGGDAIDFVRLATGCSFTQAKRFIESGTGEEFERPPRAVREVIDFTAVYESLETNFTDAMVFAVERWPHLSSSRLALDFDVKFTRHYLAIPHFGEGGEVTGIKTRSIYTGDKKAYQGSTYPRLYGKRYGYDEVLLCEGESDTWSMDFVTQDAAGDPLGLPSGVQSWKRHLDELATYKVVRLYLDNDETSQSQVDPLTDELLKRGVRVINGDLPREHKDVTDAVIAGWKPAL